MGLSGSNFPLNQSIDESDVHRWKVGLERLNHDELKHVGMYQNQSCYIWEDEHPFTSYLGFTRVPRF